ncbi:MAG: phage holin family protein [Rhodospirillales bacterium]|nr:phage holin family protein [Rhodospirillales bacterium]
MNTDNRPLPQLIGDLFDSVNRLLHQELQLVRVETTEKANEAAVGLIGIVGGMMVALASLLVLVQALVVAVANYMPAGIAALLVGVVLAIIAFILIRAGTSRLEAKTLALPKTAQSLKRDKDMVMETVQ